MGINTGTSFWLMMGYLLYLGNFNIIKPLNTVYIYIYIYIYICAENVCLFSFVKCLFNAFNS